MKRTATKAKLLTALLTLCMVLSMLPMTAQAEEPVGETADFTAADGGVRALELLNAAKTAGAMDSLWDSSTKTLTLNGVDFTTTAATAVKLPAGTTVILTEGTVNKIAGGNADAAASGGNTNKIYVYGIYAEGGLTIDGAGTLSVTAGTHKNEGDAWTYSVGIYGAGDLTVGGGSITATGGEASGYDGGYSYGVWLDNRSNLSVTGGTLTGIGGTSLRTDPNNIWKTSSYGVYVYRGNISVSGSGKLEGKCDSSMDNEEMARGINIYRGNLSVSDSAQVVATATNPIIVGGGSMHLAGGNVLATCTGDEQCSVSVTKADFYGDGNIEVNGGTLEASSGFVYIYAEGATEHQAVFTVTGGTVNTGMVYGVNKFNISGGTVQTQRISGADLTLDNVTLTVREPVKQTSNGLNAKPALWLKHLTVNSGVLDVAWNWGENTPVVLPNDEYDGYPEPLVKMNNDDYVATFNGGTTILNAGCAGNTALMLDGQLVLNNGVVETGADASHKQVSNDVPVQFAAVTTVTPINAATVANAKFDYQPGEAPQKTASVALPEDADKYEIEYEYWEEMQIDANGTATPVAFWYSDENKNNALAQDKKITVFEEGKSYMYSIQLKAKDGYVFADGCTVKVNDTATTNVSKTENGIFVFAVKTIKPVKPTPTPEPTPTYEIIEGANSAWEQNSDGTLTFRANGDFSKFTGIKVDGNVVPADQYTAASGSTIVTFSADYLKTLSAGAHTLTVLYNDGECSTAFEVTAAQNGNGGNNTGNGGNNTGNGGNNTGNGGNNTGNNGNNTGNGGNNTGNGGSNTGNSGSTNTGNTAAQAETGTAVKEPKTGDIGNHLFVWITLLVVSGGVAAGIVVYSRKRKESEAE